MTVGCRQHPTIKRSSVHRHRHWLWWTTCYVMFIYPAPSNCDWSELNSIFSFKTLLHDTLFTVQQCSCVSSRASDYRLAAFYAKYHQVHAAAAYMARRIKGCWFICWCCLDRGPGSFDVEDATTLSWSSAAVSEWVSGISLQPVLQWRHYVFAFCVAASDLPMPNIFLLLHKNTEHIRRMQSLPRTDYKWLHFGRKWNGDKGARYNSNWCQSHYTDYGSCNRRHNFMLI